MARLTTADKNIRKADVFRATFELFAGSVREIAAEAGYSYDITRKVLNELAVEGLVCQEDVNQSAQGKHRRGQFDELVWQTCAEEVSYDESTPDELFAFIAKQFPTNPVQEDTKMATRTRKPAAKPAAKPATRKPAAKPATKTEPAPSKPKRDNAALTETLVMRVREQSERLGDVAKSLGITPGQAAFLLMIHDVDTGAVKAVKVKADGAADAITKLRDGEKLSWGQIAARLIVDGKRWGEPRIKAAFKENGGTMDLIHTHRVKDDKPAAKPAAKRTAKPAAKRTRKPANPSKA